MNPIVNFTAAHSLNLCFQLSEWLTLSSFTVDFEDQHLNSYEEYLHKGKE